MADNKMGRKRIIIDKNDEIHIIIKIMINSVILEERIIIDKNEYFQTLIATTWLVSLFLAFWTTEKAPFPKSCPISYISKILFRLLASEVPVPIKQVKKNQITTKHKKTKKRKK